MFLNNKVEFAFPWLSAENEKPDVSGMGGSCLCPNTATSWESLGVEADSLSLPPLEASSHLPPILEAVIMESWGRELTGNDGGQ